MRTYWLGNARRLSLLVVLLAACGGWGGGADVFRKISMNVGYSDSLLTPYSWDFKQNKKGGISVAQVASRQLTKPL